MKQLSLLAREILKEGCDDWVSLDAIDYIARALLVTTLEEARQRESLAALRELASVRLILVGGAVDRFGVNMCPPPGLASGFWVDAGLLSLV